MQRSTYFAENVTEAKKTADSNSGGNGLETLCFRN